jgi:hypothetical protein
MQNEELHNLYSSNYSQMIDKIKEDHFSRPCSSLGREYKMHTTSWQKTDAERSLGVLCQSQGFVLNRTVQHRNQRCGNVISTSICQACFESWASVFDTYKTTLAIDHAGKTETGTNFFIVNLCMYIEEWAAYLQSSMSC